MSFWGPIMRELLAELRTRGIHYGSMGPRQFADFMDAMTGLEPRRHLRNPDYYARQWLDRLTKPHE